MRALVTGVFLTATGVTGVEAFHYVDEAVSSPSARTYAVAVYWILRTVTVAALSYFIAVREESRRPSRDPLAFIACFVALGAVVVLRQPSETDSTALVLIGDVVALLSYVWLLASVVALGRCFGLLPEVRGLVTHGPYRFVRHPVYLGEIGAVFGFVLGALSPWNVATGVLFVAAQAVRMRLEEKALTREFPEYARYAASTPRLLPR
jgi:protein-S-isoprenylcysteine O-methyltransferase Ste14